MTESWREDFADTPPFAHLAPWRGALRGPRWPELATLDHLAAAQGLSNSAGHAVRFAQQTRRCGQRDYEAGVLATGNVPSRERNWHDLLNALCWLAFPRSKAILNQVQCAALGETHARRNSASDAATLFDESGLILVGADTRPADLLIRRRWQRAFVTHREDWRSMRAYAIGHAVLEKLLTPWPGITAKCLFVSLPGDAPLATVDAAVSAIWASRRIQRPAELFPLPVLGIPGWWPANADPAFYADETVFRPAPSVISRAR